MEFHEYFAAIAYAVAGVGGAIAIYFIWKTHKIKYEHAKLEHDHTRLLTDHTKLLTEIARSKLKQMGDEAENRMSALRQTAEVTTRISDSIAEKLIDNPSWLDKFMDQTGVTYSASVYGKRIGHFFYEKRRIAKEAIDRVEARLKEDDPKRYCLLIDSGTTMYPVFQEITTRLHQKDVKDLWREKVCVVTNNIPGMQYLMKNAKDDPNDDYSEIAIDCFLVPGKPLSVYAAITGSEAENWLHRLKDFLHTLDGRETSILGFVTGNYLARMVDEANNKSTYCPVARGGGHVQIKKKMVEISDQVFLLSPLMKFSFASVDLLNRVNGFDIDPRQTAEAQRHPNKVRYSEIPIPDEKNPVFVTTKRPRGYIFERFGQELHVDLRNRYKAQSIVMPEFNVGYWNSSLEENRHLEVEREIPHTNLRRQYEQGNNIWDQEWVLENEGKR